MSHKRYRCGTILSKQLVILISTSITNTFTQRHHYGGALIAAMGIPTLNTKFWYIFFTPKKEQQFSQQNEPSISNNNNFSFLRMIAHSASWFSRGRPFTS